MCGAGGRNGRKGKGVVSVQAEVCRCEEVCVEKGKGVVGQCGTCESGSRGCVKCVCV